MFASLLPLPVEHYNSVVVSGYSFTYGVLCVVLIWLFYFWVSSFLIYFTTEVLAVPIAFWLQILVVMKIYYDLRSYKSVCLSPVGSHTSHNRYFQCYDLIWSKQSGSGTIYTVTLYEISSLVSCLFFLVVLFTIFPLFPLFIASGCNYEGWNVVTLRFSMFHWLLVFVPFFLKSSTAFIWPRCFMGGLMHFLGFSFFLR